MPRVFKMHRAAKPATAVTPLRSAKPLRAGRVAQPAEPDPAETDKVPEIGGPAGPEPTRYGDWERKGICVDF